MRDLDGTWRLVHRGPARGFGTGSDSHDSYIFQKRYGFEAAAIQTRVMPVAAFWGIAPARAPDELRELCAQLIEEAVASVP